jgi:catechol 2,3-dioxygenase-like lactoylglutathione lyase family enzyme
MSSPQMIQAEAAPAAATVDLKLEVVVIPVADVERSKRFYEGLGWRVDGDFRNGPDWRAVQMTPPGSACSIHFGTSITTAEPGSSRNLYLVVADMEKARAELLERGVDVSEAFHFTSIGGTRLPGRDPDGRSYNTYATFSDPDGNGWLLQEITTRLPGRGFSSLDVPTLTDLLKEAETGHGRYEPTSPTHHWSDWYAAYVVTRAEGRTPEEASTAATRHVDALLQRGRP